MIINNSNKGFILFYIFVSDSFKIIKLISSTVQIKYKIRFENNRVEIKTISIKQV